MGPLPSSTPATPTASAQYICSCPTPSLCQIVLCSYRIPSSVVLPDPDPLLTQPVLDLILLGVLWSWDLPASALDHPQSPGNPTCFVFYHVFSLCASGVCLPDPWPLLAPSSLALVQILQLQVLALGWTLFNYCQLLKPTGSWIIYRESEEEKKKGYIETGAASIIKQRQ